MTLTIKLDLDTVKVKQHAKYLSQLSFHSKVITFADIYNQ